MISDVHGEAGEKSNDSFNYRRLSHKKDPVGTKLLEKYKYPYLSIDLLKMGLIRSKNTELTPEDDEELETYLWPIVREMVKTAIENKQNLIVEAVTFLLTGKKIFRK